MKILKNILFSIIVTILFVGLAELASRFIIVTEYKNFIYLRNFKYDKNKIYQFPRNERYRRGDTLLRSFARP